MSKTRVTMKILFCFIICLNVCFGERTDYWNRDVDDDVYRDIVYEDHHEHSDHENSIIRPCDFKDLDCIRSVFTDNSQCLPAKGTVFDTYMLERLKLRLPHANISCILYNTRIQGLDKWTIKEFYVNKETQKLVLEVVFDKIVIASPKVNIIYHRKGKEPLEVSDYSNIEYHGVSLTLTIPFEKELLLSEAHVYSYIPDASPIYKLGDVIYGHKDPDFKLAVKNMEKNIGFGLQELFVDQGPVLMSIFLKSAVCDIDHY